MDEIIYRRGEAADAAELARLREYQLKEECAEVNRDLYETLKRYFEECIEDGSFISWVATDGDEIVATSGLSFVRKPPYYANPTGKIGILSSMYTKPEYRRRGYSKKLLDLQIEEAKAYGCGKVQLTASPMGMLLYQDYGFTENKNFVQLFIK